MPPAEVAVGGPAPAEGPVRAQVWTGATGFALRELPRPVPGPGEVLVRVRTAAICGSDRHTVAGLRASPCPGILGHEGVGQIVALGTGTEPATDVDGRALAAGDRIVWSVVSSCGDCDRCHAGHTAKCRRLRKAGHEGLGSSWPLSGSYATHVLLPAGHAVVRVGTEVPDGAAAISACAGATVMAALDAVPQRGTAGPGRTGPDLAGGRVLVNGAGMLGLLAVIAARSAGAADVVAVDPSPARRALAERAGARRALAPGGGAAGSAPGRGDGAGGSAPEHGGGPVPEPVGPVDLALEFSGAPAGVAAAIEALDVGGTAVLAGSVFPGPAVPLDPEALVRGRRTLVGVHNYEPRHLAAAVALLSSPAAAVLEDPAVLSTPIGLDEVPAAFAAPTEHLRTLVRP